MSLAPNCSLSAEVGQHLVRVLGRDHLAVDLGDTPVRSDQIADPCRARRIGRLGGAVGQADLLVGVAQQVEGKVELLPEPVVGVRLVEADAQDDRVLGGEV